VPRVLLVTPGHEDYLADSLLHGLRSLLGTAVVDFPKAEPMYRSWPSARQGELYGRGFSLYRTLDDEPIDRYRVRQRAYEGEFDLVVFADIWGSFGFFAEWAPQLTGTRLAVIDGSDRPEPYPYAGAWWRERAWWFLPRAQRRALYFKREISPLTGWFRSYLTLPPPLSDQLPSVRRMQEIAFSFPAEKILDAPSQEKDRLFATHVVDPEVAARLGHPTSYAFADETEYYADLQRSRFGITARRAGWDSLRHYEIAANGCVPCFRDLDVKPPRCAPHGLDRTNCVSYRDADDLLEKVAAIDDTRYAELLRGAMAWARANTTVERARRFLARCGLVA
jgi:hypothetical protein